MTELSPLYSRQDERVRRRYDAPKWAALTAAAAASLLAILLLGAVRFLFGIMG